MNYTLIHMWLVFEEKTYSDFSRMQSLLHTGVILHIGIISAKTKSVAQVLLRVTDIEQDVRTLEPLQSVAYQGTVVQRMQTERRQELQQ